MVRKELIAKFKELAAEESQIMDEMNSIRKMIVQIDSGLLKEDEPEEEAKIPEMLTIKEASTRTGLSYYAIRELCMNNKITYITVGKKYLVNMGKLSEFLNGKQAQA